MNKLKNQVCTCVLAVAGTIPLASGAYAEKPDSKVFEYQLAQADNNNASEAEKAERKAQRKAERKAQRKAEKEAQEKAERKAQRQAERKAQRQAEREAQKKAERKAQRQAERKAQRQAEREAQRKAERKAQRQAERKAQRQAEQEAQEKAERKAQRQAERKAQRQAEREAKRRAQQAESGSVQEEVSVEEAKEKIAKQAEAEAKKPAKVSKRAKKPKTKTRKTLEAQIENADQEPVAIVPDNLTQKQRKRLANAEKRRRAERRKKRRELIGAVAAGIAVGAVLPQLGGRVAADEGDRFVVERNGRYFVRKDDSYLIRGDGSRAEYEQLRRGRVKETITRPNGVQVITVRDPGGTVLRRVKKFPNGDRVVLYDFRDDGRPEYVDYDRRLPPLRVRRPLDEYIVSARRADRSFFYDTFQSEPVEYVEDGYSLQAIRDNERLRASVSRIDLDTVTFASGSSYVSQSQVFLLGDIAGAMLDVIYDNPAAVFMIEGHTDAVGSELSNLTLSDRRAETVAQILVEAYDVPPENLVTQGYGESYLKVDTLGPSQANRRVTVRNISPILYSSNE